MHLLFYTLIGDVVTTSTSSLTAFPNLLLSVIQIFRLYTPIGLGLVSVGSQGIAVPTDQNHFAGPTDTQVLILGGGVTGVMAARTLHQRGINNFKIIEARDTLGGRMKSFSFGATDSQYVLELGAEWIHGTQTNDGPSNPIFDLARKHNLSTQPNHYTNMTTYDHTGPVDYTQTLRTAIENFAAMTIGGGDRILRGLVDTTTRSGYALVGAKPRTPHEAVSEYYQFDWEYSQTPEQSSWLASSWVTCSFYTSQTGFAVPKSDDKKSLLGARSSWFVAIGCLSRIFQAVNFTYNGNQGGFSSENLLTTDQRGFATIIQSEAAEFLSEEQVLLNATVETITYSKDRVLVSLSDGSRLSADYALVTFSLGVLQHDDVLFEPALPKWKSEAIHGMAMGIYTKIFLQFREKFWFDTEFALYADHERGWYPVWQNLDMDGFLPGSGILFVTVTGDFSKRIESLSDEIVKAEVLAVLRSMYPNTTIPEPDAFYFPRWHSDPLYRGSYSNWPSGFLKTHHTNLRATVQERLWFAGEATSLKHYGYLHGAYYEGQKMGEEIARCIEDGGCDGLAHVEEIACPYPYIASDFI